MEAILTNVGLIVTNSVSWLGTFAGAITATGNEIIQVFVILSLAGIGVGFLKRLMRL